MGAELKKTACAQFILTRSTLFTAQLRSRSMVHHPIFIWFSFVLLLLGFRLEPSSCLQAPTAANGGPKIQPVRRMSAKEYCQARKQVESDGGKAPLEVLDRPILIQGVMEDSMCAEICQEIMMRMIESNTLIQVQQQQQTTNDQIRTKSIMHDDCSFLQALDFMMDSIPGNSFFAFSEGVLEDHHEPQEILCQIRESIFQEIPEDALNWFDYFPENLQPSDCLIMAGQGATSTLHRDPFEWTGTSLCLEGRKIWRFLQPIPSVQDMDEALESYRLISTAWDHDDDHNDHNHDTNKSSEKNNSEKVISSGWQSDESLYQINDQSGLPSAQELVEGMTVEESQQLLEQVAEENIPTKWKKDNMVIEWTVQQAGDLLLIPPYWYHQTLAPEPSMAVASQRCGSALDARRVFNHILSLQKNNKNDDGPYHFDRFMEEAIHTATQKNNNHNSNKKDDILLDSSTAQLMVKRLFDHVLSQ